MDRRRRPRSRPPSRLSPPAAPKPQIGPFAKLVGGLLVVAAVAFFYASTRQTPPLFPFDRQSFGERWNETAVSLAHPELQVGSVDWTDEEAGVFGYAWSPTLSVLGRVVAPGGRLDEMAVIGSPQDGSAVLAAMETLIAVAEPGLTATQRREVLEQLALGGERIPAQPEAAIIRGRTRFRVAADADLGRIGIGAVPIASDR